MKPSQAGKPRAASPPGKTSQKPGFPNPRWPNGQGVRRIFLSSSIPEAAFGIRRIGRVGSGATSNQTVHRHALVFEGGRSKPAFGLVASVRLDESFRFGSLRRAGLAWQVGSVPQLRLWGAFESAAVPWRFGSLRSAVLLGALFFSGHGRGGTDSVELGGLHSCRPSTPPRRVLQGRRGEKPQRGRYRSVPVWREASASRRQVSDAQPGSPSGETLGCALSAGPALPVERVATPVRR